MAINFCKVSKERYFGWNRLRQQPLSTPPQLHYNSLDAGGLEEMAGIFWIQIKGSWVGDMLILSLMIGLYGSSPVVCLSHVSMASTNISTTYCGMKIKSHTWCHGMKRSCNTWPWKHAGKGRETMLGMCRARRWSVSCNHQTCKGKWRIWF